MFFEVQIFVQKLQIRLRGFSGSRLYIFFTAAAAVVEEGSGFFFLGCARGGVISGEFLSGFARKSINDKYFVDGCSTGIEILGKFRL